MLIFVLFITHIELEAQAVLTLQRPLSIKKVTPTHSTEAMLLLFKVAIEGGMQGRVHYLHFVSLF